MIKKLILVVILLAAVGVFLYSGYKVYDTYTEYQKIDDLNEELSTYKPGSGGELYILEQAKEEYKNEDISGWITIPDTNVDYMVVQGSDNDYYLNHGVNGQWLSGGSIFMDYRNNYDYSDFNTVIYGHQMNNGSMFEDIRKFRKEDFFNSHPTATIYSLNREFKVEFFAFLLVGSDHPVYELNFTDDNTKAAHLEKLITDAAWTRDVDVSTTDHIVTLSTCTYEFDDARAVLVGKLTQVDN